MCNEESNTYLLPYIYKTWTAATGHQKFVYYLDDIPQTPKDDTMYNPTETQTQRSYLTTRVWQINNEKYRALLKQFGLTVDGVPTKAEDLVKRIQEGKFEVKSKDALELIRSRDEDDDYYCGGALERMMYSEIIWRDPTVVRDEEGYKRAVEAKDKLLQETKDIIALKPVDEAYEAVKAFEKATFH